MTQALSLAILLTVATPSLAHVDLLTPVPREHGLSPEPNASLKQGPCGQEQNGRTSRVNVFSPGATIEVTFREFVNHRSYYRVAFDADSDDDFPLFPGSGVAPGGEPPNAYCPVDGRVILAYELADGNGGTHTLAVTLPDVECDNCTLQLTQYMYDTSRPYYFQCADLILQRGQLDAGALGGGIDAGRDATTRMAPLMAPPDFSSFKAAPSCSVRPPSADAGTGGASGDSGDPLPSDASPPPKAGFDMAAGARRRSGGCTMTPAPEHDGRYASCALLALALVGRVGLRRRHRYAKSMTPRGEYEQRGAR